MPYNAHSTACTLPNKTIAPLETEACKLQFGKNLISMTQTSHMWLSLKLKQVISLPVAAMWDTNPGI